MASRKYEDIETGLVKRGGFGTVRPVRQLSSGRVSRVYLNIEFILR